MLIKPCLVDVVEHVGVPALVLDPGEVELLDRGAAIDAHIPVPDQLDSVALVDACHVAELARDESVGEAVDDLTGVFDLVFVQALEGDATEVLSVDELANDGFVAQAPPG